MRPTLALWTRATDLLNEYVKHVASAVFACPPGLREGQRWGQDLFS